MSLRTTVVFLSAVLVCCFSLLSKTKPEQTFIALIKGDAMKQTVSELVQCGNRTGGSSSGNTAARYLVRSFKSAGLQTEVIEDTEMPVYELKRWSLRVNEPRRLRGVFTNAAPAMFSPQATFAEVPIRYFDVSASPELNQFKDVVVLTDRFSHSIYRSMVNAGAKAVLSYSTAVELAASAAHLVSLDPEDELRIPLFNISRKSGNTLRSALDDSVNITITGSINANIHSGKPKTVIATLKGKSRKYYIVCAHGDSDSGGPGADDNASGVSVVVELAKSLEEMVRSRSLPMPEASLKFIVWGAEYHSSRDFVKINGDSLQNILGVINLDQVGIGATRKCLYFESNDVPQNERLLGVFDAIGVRYAGRKGFWKESTTTASLGGTDSYVFLPDQMSSLGVASVDIPSITVFTAAWNSLRKLEQPAAWRSKAWRGPIDTVYVDYSSYYHSTLDIPFYTTDRNAYRMEWAAKAIGLALIELNWKKKTAPHP